MLVRHVRAPKAAGGGRLAAEADSVEEVDAADTNTVILGNGPLMIAI